MVWLMSPTVIRMKSSEHGVDLVDTREDLRPLGQRPRIHEEVCLAFAMTIGTVTWTKNVRYMRSTSTSYSYRCMPYSE